MRAEEGSRTRAWVPVARKLDLMPALSRFTRLRTTRFFLSAGLSSELLDRVAPRVLMRPSNTCAALVTLNIMRITAPTESRTLVSRLVWSTVQPEWKF